jgi:hypothetical protein
MLVQFCRVVPRPVGLHPAIGKQTADSRQQTATDSQTVTIGIPANVQFSYTAGWGEFGMSRIN